MSNFPKHPNPNTIFRLTVEDQQDPIKVIKRIFNTLDLTDLRIELGEILFAVIASDQCNFDEGIKRANAMFLCKQIEEIFEASFLLLKQKRKGKKK